MKIQFTGTMRFTIRQIQVLFLHERSHLSYRAFECYKTTVRICLHGLRMQGISKLSLLYPSFMAHLFLSHSKLVFISYESFYHKSQAG